MASQFTLPLNALPPSIITELRNTNGQLNESFINLISDILQKPSEEDLARKMFINSIKKDTHVIEEENFFDTFLYHFDSIKCTTPFCFCLCSYFSNILDNFINSAPNEFTFSKLLLEYDKDYIIFNLKIDYEDKQVLFSKIKLCKKTYLFKKIKIVTSTKANDISDSLLHINNAIFDLFKYNLIAIVSLQVIIEREKIKIYQQLRKCQLQICNFLEIDLLSLYSKNLFFNSLGKLKCTTKKECVICYNDIEEFVKYKFCNHTDEICYKCWQEIILNNKKECPICRYSIVDNSVKIKTYFIKKIQTFIRKRLKNTVKKKNKFYIPGHEKICYRCAEKNEETGEIIPNRTHSYDECVSNKCSLCFYENDIIRKGYGHSRGCCQFKMYPFKDEIPCEFRYQLRINS